jgi:hypothetical protein
MVTRCSPEKWGSFSRDSPATTRSSSSTRSLKKRGGVGGGGREVNAQRMVHSDGGRDAWTQTWDGLEGEVGSTKGVAPDTAHRRMHAPNDTDDTGRHGRGVVR